ncbi:MAG: hypothetical protein KAW12_23515 [Candidatus Aminicenantes bacterium]|nr:hypothetical protein [Candidatus Aminicenantes bacterium]
MFGTKSLRLTGLITLIFFVFFIGSADFIQASGQEDDLDKARRLYQEGDYETSIKLLGSFIEKLKAMVEQKKNVAEAFYLLAKIYFEVGDDVKVDENLRKVFETFPTFKKDESNFSFRDRVEQARRDFIEEKESEAAEKEMKLKDKQQPVKKKKVLAQRGEKKKKKFPVLLLVGGIAVVAILVLLLSKKDKYDITGTWTMTGSFQGTPFLDTFTFTGSKTSGSFVDSVGDGGTYTVNDKDVSFRYSNYDIVFNGTFNGANSMSGSIAAYGLSGNWSASRTGGGSMAAAVGSAQRFVDVLKQQGKIN